MDSFPYLLLTLIALSGEFPTTQVRRLPGSATYADSIVKRLKREKLIRTYYRDGLRGLRLTAQAKRLMAKNQPDWFLPLFTGDTMTNAPKYTVPHRLRLHRMTEVLVTMLNAGVIVFPWEKPVVFSPTPLPAPPCVEQTCYFSSREMKNIGLASNKIRNSRAAGLLLAPDSIFAVYNSGSSEMKWEYNAEIRLQTMIQTELRQRLLHIQFADAEQGAIMFGADMDRLPPLMGMRDGSRQKQFVLSGSFRRCHFLTSDDHGEIVLRLLCDPDARTILDSSLSQGLDPCRPNWMITNDAMDGDSPVLFAYTCDVPRIKRFDSALDTHGQGGLLFCFDFQADALRQICGQEIKIQSLDFSTVKALLDREVF